MNHVLELQAIEADDSGDALDLHSGGEGAFVTGDLSGGEGSSYYETEPTDFEPGV